MTIKLGLVGTGTVGGGCIDILQKHKEDFKRHYGIDVELARVCSRDPKQAEAHGVSDLFTLDYHNIVNDPDIDIVIEVMGGLEPAKTYVLRALAAGKTVVSASSSAAPRSRATWSCRHLRRARTSSRPTRRSWRPMARKSCIWRRR